jgi:hypothetical protein
MMKSLGRLETVVGIAVGLLALFLVLTASSATRAGDGTGATGARRASSGAATSVSLAGDRSQVGLGSFTRMRGWIEPARVGETVVVFDAAGRELASLETDVHGGFTFRFAPRQNQTVSARWGEAVSEAVFVEVRALARVRLEGLDRSRGGRAVGKVGPVISGGAVTITALRDGTSIDTSVLEVDESGSFSYRFPARRAGAYRVRVAYRAPNVVTGEAVSNSLLLAGRAEIR